MEVIDKAVIGEDGGRRKEKGVRIWFGWRSASRRFGLTSAARALALEPDADLIIVGRPPNLHAIIRNCRSISPFTLQFF
jgi:hypothetical protein